MKVKSYLKFGIKLALTSAALYFVFTRIDFREFIHSLSTANLWFFTLAFLFYHISKIISAFRIRYFYNAAGVDLNVWYSIKLYYVGMLYNLSLPGAIGGDGYKIYLLRQTFPGSDTKKLIGATILDRISGLVVLCLLGLLFLLLSPFDPGFPYYEESVAAIILALFPAYYFATWKFFSVFRSKFFITSLFSVGVQSVQALSAVFILLALRVDQLFVNYLALFFASSIASVAPITIGGAGARELVFFYGYHYLYIDRPVAIAFSLLFFIITVLASLFGLFFSFKIDEPLKQGSRA